MPASVATSPRVSASSDFGDAPLTYKRKTKVGLAGTGTGPAACLRLLAVRTSHDPLGATGSSTSWTPAVHDLVTGIVVRRPKW